MRDEKRINTNRYEYRGHRKCLTNEIRSMMVEDVVGPDLRYVSLWISQIGTVCTCLYPIREEEALRDDLRTDTEFDEEEDERIVWSPPK